MKFSDKIITLRKKAGISQEKLASICDVSRQAEQKWENGKAIPTLDILVKLSDFFNVSLDSLILDRHERKTGGEEVSGKNYDLMYEWKVYSRNLFTEYEQCVSEGKDVKKYKGLFDEISRLHNSQEKEDLASALFKLISKEKQVENYKYYEPNGLEEIKELRDDFDFKLVKPKKTLLKEKIAGAWYGRIAGCLLGKPVECALSYNIEYILKHSDNYPMKRYILSTDIDDEVREKTQFPFWCTSFGDNTFIAPSDDDTNYTVLAQKLIETYGKNFKPINVLDNWVTSQPQTSYCTAELVAYTNYTNGYVPPETATYKNPFRELIGAQIRVDYYGYICPGDVETASTLAYNDAVISHTKNGVYGAMMIAAMISAAAVCEDVETVIKAGLHVIPKTSRMYEFILSVLEDFKDGKGEKYILDKIHSSFNEKEKFGEIHSISNAAIVVLYLLKYSNDYGKAICATVQAGYDTDCNGATIGSIIGMLNGKSSIEEKWLSPLGGKLQTGLGIFNIEELIKKTLEHVNK